MKNPAKQIAHACQEGEKCVLQVLTDVLKKSVVIIIRDVCIDKKKDEWITVKIEEILIKGSNN